MTEREELKIRPYARLITMLGDQLIKNEQVALIEIIKNAYDADAKNVKISFNNFGEKFEINDESSIIIEDDGVGMTSDIVKSHWLNPATPVKKRRKDTDKSKTKLGRVIQGEKGIGRFSLFKLGQDIHVVTKAESELKEQELIYDFSKYGVDFLKEDNVEKDVYLDDLSVSYVSRDLNIFKNKPHGTRIEIRKLNGTWSRKKIDNIFSNFHTLYSLFQDDNNIEFSLTIEKNGEKLYDPKSFGENVEDLLNDKSVLQIKNGRYDEGEGAFYYNENGAPKVLKLTDSEIRGLYPYKNDFEDEIKDRTTRDGFKTDCGSFKFTFYVFDFALTDVPVKYRLDKNQRDLIKDNKIYLYRDNIRVFPYGEPEDDWLQIDVSRGRISAGTFLSTDQVVGRIDITQDGNPDLKDKTNREGLIEEGNATSDFITLIKIFLAYIRKGPYQRYKEKNKTKSDHDFYKTNPVQKTFTEFSDLLGDNPSAKSKLIELQNMYATEKQYLERRIKITEELAGVGLSVESTSHDILSFISKSNQIISRVTSDLILRGKESSIVNDLGNAHSMMMVIQESLQNIQSLFTSASKRKQSIAIKDVLQKLKSIYKRTLDRENINLEILSVGAVLTAKTTDAVLLQLFINLFDNAIYWLDTVDEQNKMIKISIDGYSKEVTFADNGPGISNDDLPYIFEPFYSGKGEEGRGLGLYIARQLLEKNDYCIDVIETNSDKLLDGANFIIDFNTKESK